MNKIERLNVSKNVHYHQISDNIFLGWNRFYPKIVKFNKQGLDFINNINRSNKLDETLTKHSDLITTLLDSKILYSGDIDLSEIFFYDLVSKKLFEIDQSAQGIFHKSLDYAQLYIHNEPCNLNCTCCAKAYQNHTPKSKLKASEKLKLISMVMDQYIERKMKNKQERISISFNGGEILMDWDIFKNLILHNEKKYPGLQFYYFANTNMTLMTREIAEFLSNYNFSISVSIDGYQEAHDRLRTYKNGKGSYNDVIKGIKIYREYNKRDILNSVQGIIENSDDFDIYRVYELSQQGFMSAALSPNLLNISEADAVKKAQIMNKMFELNKTHALQAGENTIALMKKVLTQKEYTFEPWCMGLSAYPRAGIFLNISTMSLSNICCYVNQASIPVEAVDSNIYHPLIWESSRAFINARFENLKNNCACCEIIAICRGNCLISGLDNLNKTNKAACRYQLELWKYLLSYLYKTENEHELGDLITNNKKSN